MTKSPFESTMTVVDTIDPLLEKLAETVKPVAEQLETSDDHALMIFGIKYNGEDGIQTYTIASGYFGIIAEGLHAELADQLSNGKPGLFMVFRQVIKDLEEDFGIDEETVLNARPTLN